MRILNLFSCTFIATSVLIRKTHIDFVIDDLRDDLEVFLHHHIHELILQKNQDALQNLLVATVEEHCVVSITDSLGKILVNSEGRLPVIDTNELKIARRKGYSYAIRKDNDGHERLSVVEPIKNDQTVVGFIQITSSLKHLRQFTRRLIRTLTIIFAAAMLLAGISSSLLSRSIYVPIAQMTAIAKDIALEKLDKRVPITNRKDEIGILVNVFNNMIDKLHTIKKKNETQSSQILHTIL